MRWLLRGCLNSISIPLITAFVVKGFVIAPVQQKKVSKCTAPPQLFPNPNAPPQHLFKETSTTDEDSIGSWNLLLLELIIYAHNKYNSFNNYCIIWITHSISYDENFFISLHLMKVGRLQRSVNYVSYFMNRPFLLLVAPNNSTTHFHPHYYFILSHT